MRINRRFLYWGVFLVALGGVLVASDLRVIDAAVIADALRLWPLALVAIGFGLVLRRTQFSVPGGMLAAAVPGLVLGGAFVVTPNLALLCGPDREPASVATNNGTFDGPARISVTAACGLVDINTSPGNGWQLSATNAVDRPPIVDASSRTLSIEAGAGRGWRAFRSGGEEWHLTLPTTAIDELSLEVNAGEGRISLPDAQIGNLEIATNAGQTTVDLTEASVASLSGEINAGRLSFHLPANADVVGTLEVNAGELQVCTPAGVGLRVRHDGALNGISINGQHESDADWQSQDYASAAHHADLTVDVNLGNVTINPIGGCR